MKKRYLALLGFLAIIVILILGKMGIINLGYSSENSFHDNTANYTVKKSKRVEADGNNYVVILLTFENKSNRKLIPWENSSFVIEQDGPIRVLSLNRVLDYNDAFGNEEAFKKAFESIDIGEKEEIELVYKIDLKDSPIYIRGIENGNNFEYTIK